jgi:hypothetical protein
LRLLLALALMGGAAPALTCVPPPPQVQLPGEDLEAFRSRAEAFNRARDDDDRRRYQAELFDRASRVSLARVVTASSTPRLLSDGLSNAWRVEAQPLVLFKGPASTNAPVAIEDNVMTTCGPGGGGTATRVPVGSYIILFENVGSGATTGHIGIRMAELVESRMLRAFNESVVKAGLAVPAQ